jgi:hypothetical protein
VQPHRRNLNRGAAAAAGCYTSQRIAVAPVALTACVRLHAEVAKLADALA